MPGDSDSKESYYWWKVCIFHTIFDLNLNAKRERDHPSPFIEDSLKVEFSSED